VLGIGLTSPSDYTPRRGFVLGGASGAFFLTGLLPRLK